MNMLSQVTRGNKVQKGQRIVISGVEKVGKTTLACGAPSSLLVPLEMGYGAMQNNQLPLLTTWNEVESVCLELTASAQRGQVPRGSSIVWDSATALERIIHSEVLRTDPDNLKGQAKNLTMESAHGGYGKAYNIANDYFNRWTRYQDALAFYGGINCVVTCHVFAAKVVDPAFGEYQTWDLLLHSPKNEKNYGKRELITQWADLIGFLHEPLFVMKAEKGQSLARGISSNQGRTLAIDRAPSWVAGNRYGLSGTIQIPPVNGWNNLAAAIYQSSGLDVYNRDVVPTK